jgi:ABC-type Na+ efflux pump permease subunit
MNAFKVSFVNTIRRHFRDATPFIMQVVSPIIMIIIFGSMFSGGFSSNSVIKPIKVAIMNNDNGQSSKEFVDFLNNKTLAKFVTVNQVADLTATKKALKENKYDTRKI